MGPEYWDAVKSYLLFSAHFFLKYVLQSFAQYFCTFFYNFNIFPIIFFKIFRAIFFLSLCIFYTISFQTFFQNTITILDAVIASQIFLHPRIWDPHITPVPKEKISIWITFHLLSEIKIHNFTKICTIAIFKKLVWYKEKYSPLGYIF